MTIILNFTASGFPHCTSNIKICLRTIQFEVLTVVIIRLMSLVFKIFSPFGEHFKNFITYGLLMFLNHFCKIFLLWMFSSIILYFYKKSTITYHYKFPCPMISNTEISSATSNYHPDVAFQNTSKTSTVLLLRFYLQRRPKRYHFWVLT